MSTKTFACPNCVRMQRCLEKYGWAVKPCDYCADTHEVTVDSVAIAKAMIVKGAFRRSRPKAVGYDPKPGKAVFGAGYVWRMIRFHNGADMCMPVMAPDYVGGSENKELIDHLDKVVDAIGDALFGKVQMMRAAAGWGRALGLDSSGAVYAAVDKAVGMPMGDGYDIGGADESPEAFIEHHTTEDGELDLAELAEDLR